MPLTTDSDYLNSERSKYRDLILAEYGSKGDYIYDIAAIESWKDGSLTTFEYNGSTYLRMHDSHTGDGGHPNEAGRVPLAQAMWVLFANIVDPSASGIEEKGSVPEKTNLHQNYPNPFNPETTINYSISDLTDVDLIVYNNLGQLIQTVVKNKQPGGSYTISFNGNNLPSGVYYYRLTAGNYVKTNKMLLIR